MESVRDRICRLDRQYLWHPYTQMNEYQQIDPFVIERAEGSRLFDQNGQSYIDANASWWVSALGHQHPRLVQAVQEQAGKFCHVSLAGMTHQPAAELAEAICRHAPQGLDHVFYSDDGSTAVEVALKLSLQYWAQNGHPRRKRFVSLEGAFHGETLGVSALGGVEVFHHLFAGASSPNFQICSPAEDLNRSCEELEKILAAHHEEIAAVVIEPLVQGAAGMKIYSPDFLQIVREQCSRFDVFLVFDEVFTGYGRTGKMWASDHGSGIPDILCSAKGFSGGMLPMAATLMTDRIFEGFLGEKDRAFYYGHSFCGNPLGAAVALEVLKVFEEEEILLQIQPRIQRIRDGFAAFAKIPGVKSTRSLGMIGALDLEGDQGYLARAGWDVFEEAKKRGAYLRPMGNVVYVTPALTIPEEDLEELLHIVEESLGAVLSGR